MQGVNRPGILGPPQHIRSPRPVERRTETVEVATNRVRRGGVALRDRAGSALPSHDLDWGCPALTDRADNSVRLPV